MGHRFNAAILMILVLVMGCVPNAPPVEPSNIVIAGDCAGACANLATLECPEATDDCVPFCEAMQRSGGARQLAVGCVEAAKSQDEVRQCRVECK